MANTTIKFYKCVNCDCIMGMIQSDGRVPACCGEELKELVPNTVDAAQEKHVPVITVNGNTVHVAVGSVVHPMEDDHYIQWIYLQTQKGGQRKILSPNEKPEADFVLTPDDKPIAAYEYCNKHGLWKADV